MCPEPLPPCRTLHCAEDAVDTKWVMQQWVSGGVGAPAAAAASPAVERQVAPDPELLLARKGRSKSKQGRKPAPASGGQRSKGFGPR